MPSTLVLSTQRNRFYVRKDPAERFWSKVEKRGPEECWPWLGSHSVLGRAMFYFNGRVQNAARAALVLSGRNLNADQLACHSCDNRNCVNPTHIYAGTYTDNINDAYARGQQKGSARSRPGSKHHMAKLTESNVKNIRILYADGYGTMKDIGEQYGITAAAINAIVKRKTWRHIS